MHLFVGYDINTVYLSALKKIRLAADDVCFSRAGNVFDLGPAYFEFTRPENQLLMLRGRKYNPYFAIVEAAWVLNGSNNLSSLNKIITGYDKYSDDGVSLNGAYGHRAQKYFDKNQIELAISLLENDPASRRAVVTFYSPSDLDNNESFDIPCNTSLFLKIRNNALDITIINRSNDVFLGVPYNVFVFNVLQRYVAQRLGLKLGVQRHFTDSLHLYERDFLKVEEILKVNTVEEISSWRKYSLSEYIYSALMNDFEVISSLELESIVCHKTRKLLKDYISWKADNNKDNFFTDSPSDVFEISSMLWNKSRKQNR